MGRFHENVIQEDPSLQLSPEQEKDYDQHKYKTQFRVDIPGITSEEGYLVLVNNSEIWIRNTEFKLFLRLVEKWKKNNGGLIKPAQLQKDGAITNHMAYQY